MKCWRFSIRGTVRIRREEGALQLERLRTANCKQQQHRECVCVSVYECLWVFVSVSVCGIHLQFEQHSPHSEFDFSISASDCLHSTRIGQSRISHHNCYRYDAHQREKKLPVFHWIYNNRICWLHDFFFCPSSLANGCCVHFTLLLPVDIANNKSTSFSDEIFSVVSLTFCAQRF